MHFDTDQVATFMHNVAVIAYMYIPIVIIQSQAHEFDSGVQSNFRLAEPDLEKQLGVSKQ